MDSGRGLSLDLEGDELEYDQSCNSEPNLNSVGGGARTDEAPPPDVPRPYSSTAILDPSRRHQTEACSTGELVT